jgi:hypothetical protein
LVLLAGRGGTEAGEIARRIPPAAEAEHINVPSEE